MNSNIEKDKTAYHIVMKYYMSLKRISWLELPDDLIPENLCQEIQNLLPYQQLIVKLSEIESTKDKFEAMINELPEMSDFSKMLVEFCQFYKVKAREQLLYFSKVLQDTIGKLQRFLLSENLLEVLAVIAEVAKRHQQFAEGIKLAKAYRVKVEVRRTSSSLQQQPSKV